MQRSMSHDPVSNRRARLPLLRTSPLILGAASVIVSSIIVPHASASLLLWNNAAGGSISTAGNWSPVQVPVAADDLTFNVAATYNLTFNATVPTSNTLTFRNGTITLTRSSPHTVTNGVVIGDLSGDAATLTLTTGGLTSNAIAIIGDATGSVGTLNVNDDDADFIVGNGADLFVGNNGDANLNITNVGLVQVADQIIIGANATSSPTVLVSGALASPPFGVSTLRSLGTGQSRIGQGGDATMTVSNGALANFAGDVIVANGSASVSTITVQTAVLLDARLLVDGDLLLGRNTSATAAGDATVIVNNGGTVDVGGTLFVGGDVTGGVGDLQVNSGGETFATDISVGGNGTIVLGGGTVNVDGTLGVATPGVVSGTGTINGEVLNAGTITATGANGITFNGMVLQDGSTPIAGTKVHFGNGGGFQGSGAINAAIGGDAGALITALGTLAIGNNTTSGFSYNGDMNVGGSIVTLVDSNGAVLGGTTTINSGRIECPAGIDVQNGATIRGEGLFVGDVTCAGDLDPHNDAAVGGLFTIQGDLLMNPTGEIDMEIGGNPLPSPELSDRINISGTAAFDGTVRVRLKNGFTPQRGMQYIVANAFGGRTGTFDSIIAPTDVCNGVTFVLVYSSTAAIVLVRPPDADTNDDLRIDVTDLLAVISAWGPCGDVGEPTCGPANVTDSSPSGDGGVDVSDLLVVISHWGSCP